MKNILLSVLVAVGLVSCSSCAAKQTPSPGPDPTVVVDSSPPSTKVVIDGNNWELTLPDNGWSVEKNCKSDGTCLTIMVNDSRQNLLIALHKTNESSIEDFSLKEIRSVKEEGAVVNSLNHLTLSGYNFVLLEATKENVKVFVWLTISNKIGYEFSCGGLNDDGHQKDLCSGIMSTLKMK